MARYPRFVSCVSPARPLRVVLAAVVVSGTALLAGCGGDRPTQPSPDAARGIATSPTEVAPTDPEVSDFLERMGAGLGDEGSATVKVRTTGVLASTARGVIAYDGTGSRLRMTTVVPALGQMPTRLVVTDRFTYVSAPGLTPPGKYLALPSDDPLLQQWGGGGGLDPIGSLEAFQEGLREVRPLGRQRVGGTATTRYRLQVDAAASLAAQGRSAPPAMPETVGYDVWLDGEDRIRRLTTEVAGSRVVVELDRWGEQVTITPPPRRAQVTRR
jgi:hypothetical protein